MRASRILPIQGEVLLLVLPSDATGCNYMAIVLLWAAGDLKPALAAAINAILQPVRDHFASDPQAKELLKKVKVRMHNSAGPVGYRLRLCQSQR